MKENRNTQMPTRQTMFANSRSHRDQYTGLPRYGQSVSNRNQLLPPQPPSNVNQRQTLPVPENQNYIQTQRRRVDTPPTITPNTSNEGRRPNQRIQNEGRRRNIRFPPGLPNQVPAQIFPFNQNQPINAPNPPAPPVLPIQGTMVWYFPQPYLVRLPNPQGYYNNQNIQNVNYQFQNNQNHVPQDGVNYIMPNQNNYNNQGQFHAPLRNQYNFVNNQPQQQEVFDLQEDMDVLYHFEDDGFFDDSEGEEEGEEEEFGEDDENGEEIEEEEEILDDLYESDNDNNDYDDYDNAMIFHSAGFTENHEDFKNFSYPDPNEDEFEINLVNDFFSLPEMTKPKQLMPMPFKTFIPQRGDENIVISRKVDDDEDKKRDICGIQIMEEKVEEKIIEFQIKKDMFSQITVQEPKAKAAPSKNITIIDGSLIQEFFDSSDVTVSREEEIMDIGEIINSYENEERKKKVNEETNSEDIKKLYISSSDEHKLIMDLAKEVDSEDLEKFLEEKENNYIRSKSNNGIKEHQLIRNIGDMIAKDENLFIKLFLSLLFRDNDKDYGYRDTQLKESYENLDLSNLIEESNDFSISKLLNSALPGD